MEVWVSAQGAADRAAEQGLLVVGPWATARARAEVDAPVRIRYHGLI